MTFATYVYAVRRTGGPEIHSPGHDGGGPVRLLPLGSLTAVVQDVLKPPSSPRRRCGSGSPTASTWNGAPAPTTAWSAPPRPAPPPCRCRSPPSTPTTSAPGS
ncbi:GvpL/GvpF family gas vesicle protein [Streptomyces albus]|nr:GvpL/GvpF family gas vesicle protein [Streptomyces albus]